MPVESQAISKSLRGTTGFLVPFGFIRQWARMKIIGWGTLVSHSLSLGFRDLDQMGFVGPLGTNVL